MTISAQLVWKLFQDFWLGAKCVCISVYQDRDSSQLERLRQAWHPCSWSVLIDISCSVYCVSNIRCIDFQFLNRSQLAEQRAKSNRIAPKQLDREIELDFSAYLYVCRLYYCNIAHAEMGMPSYKLSNCACAT